MAIGTNLIHFVVTMMMITYLESAIIAGKY